jgi:hypothetical protein
MRVSIAAKFSKIEVIHTLIGHDQAAARANLGDNSDGIE